MVRLPTGTGQRVVDAAMVAGLYLVQVSTLAGGHNPGVLPQASPVGHVAGVAMLVPLLVRRRWPISVMGAVTAATILSQLVLPLHLVVPSAALAVAAHAVAMYAPRRTGRLTLGVFGAVLAVLLVAMAVGYELPADQWPPRLALFVVLVCGAWVLGEQTRTGRERNIELEAKTVELEKERQRSASQAAVEERLRIARELHDVLGHHVSVMVMQAAGARRVLASDQDKAVDALTAIEGAGRDAIAEMQRALSVLRDPAARRRPTLDHLEDLIGEIRDAGVSVAVHQDMAAAVPPSIDLAATRIIQESLTNVLRHTGPGASVAVHLTVGDNALTVLVEDDGQGQVPAASQVVGTGRGLIGMRERVELLAGHFEAGPRSGGGFRVCATLPLEDDRRAG